MSAFESFEINIVASVGGKTIAIQTSASGSSIAGVLDTTAAYSPHIQIANAGTSWAWCRMSSEAAPTATQSDLPLAPNSVRIYANPVPNGKLGIAVLVSVSSSQFVYFSPGQGGIS